MLCLRLDQSDFQFLKFGNQDDVSRHTYNVAGRAHSTSECDAVCTSKQLQTFRRVLKLGYSINLIRYAWNVLKYGAGEGWRRSVVQNVGE